MFVCVKDVMDIVFSVGILMRGAVGAVYGKSECFVMKMLYVCVQFSILHDLQSVHAG